MATLNGLSRRSAKEINPWKKRLALFERGQLLTKHCADLLAKAELKVQELSGETLEPYDEGE